MSILPFVATAPRVYVGAAITGLPPAHPFRQHTVAVLRALQHAGYEVLLDHMLCETQEDMWRMVAQRLGRSFDDVVESPELISDVYDLARLATADWCVFDVTEKSFGVGAELQKAWERVLAPGTFSVLLIGHAEVFESRMLSCYLGRFQSVPECCWAVAYQSTEQALSRIRFFLEGYVTRLTLVPTL